MALTQSTATSTATTVTMTAVSDIDLTTGVYGIEYGSGSSFVYDEAVSIPGAAVNQSLSIDEGDGLAAGAWSLRNYYNTDPLDPIGTRVYGEAFILYIGGTGPDFFSAVFNPAVFYTDSSAVSTPTPALGGKGDNDGRKRRQHIYKPTGLLDRPTKARKDVEDRIAEAREIEAEVATQLAREFSEESRQIDLRAMPPIQTMSEAEIDAEIGARLRERLRREQEEDEDFMVLMATIL